MALQDVALRCKNLTFGYSREAQILKGVSFEIPRGVLAAVFGRSGSGKSTLLRCLSGYTFPDGGTIKHEAPVLRSVEPLKSQLPGLGNGIATHATALISLLASIPRHPATRRGPSGEQSSSWMMFADDRNLLPHLSAVENLDLVLAPVCDDTGLRDRIIEKVLEMLGLTPVGGHLPAQLSTGQLRRVQLGQSLVGSFDLLLLDEPTAGLDSTTKYDLLELLQRIHRTIGLTGLVVTHDIETALLLSDRVLFFGDGAVVSDIDVPSKRLRNPEDLDDGEFRTLRHRMLKFLVAQKGSGR